MRLTLRTLLAWLDDTLPAAEVRQIGQLVSETPLAGELVERIHRVTRQRRLTVPPGTGPEGVDPNIVAGYIGDELPAEIVSEYEKRCLTSDVHLAEVASVHQILSLLGQKAKVPPEARQRMYHLVRGREATVAATPKPPSNSRKPVPRSAVAWTPEPLPQRSAIERFGPLAAVAALLVILCWSAYMSVGPTSPPSKTGAAGLAKATPKPAAKPAEVAPKAVPDRPAPRPDDRPAALTKLADETPQPETPDAAALPAGAEGVVGKGSFLLLRYSAMDRVWSRLAEGATLRDGDRIVNLAPSLAPVRVGTASLMLVGDTEVKVLAPAASSSRFELVRGQARVAGGETKESITVVCDSGAVTLAIPAGAVVGLERINRRVRSAAAPSPPILRVIAVEGSITVESGGATGVVEAGSALAAIAPNTLEPAAPIEPMPEWLADPNPTPASEERLKSLAKYLKPDRPLTTALIEAVDDPSPDVRADAIATVGAIGPLEVVVSTMSDKANQRSRKAAIAVLRDVARRDAESAKALRAALEKVNDSKEWVDIVEAMLVGYTPRDAADEELGETLVTLLKNDDVGTRELALETLQTIHGRGDALDYEPDRPLEGNGLKAWTDLVQGKGPRAAAAPKGR